MAVRHEVVSERECIVEQKVSSVPFSDPNSSNNEYTSFTLHTAYIIVM